MIEAGQYITDGTVTWIVTDIRDEAQVGDIKLSSVLRKGYVKANGALLTNASINYPRLVAFVEENPQQTMYVYDSESDALTIPNYQADSPIGTVISYMGNTVPANYLACNGTTYYIEDYQELADFINNQFNSYNYFGGDGTITFAVPDLRGEFLRGTGTNSHANQGNGASVGKHQNGSAIRAEWLNPNGTSSHTFYTNVEYQNALSSKYPNNVLNLDSVLYRNAIPLSTSLYERTISATMTNIGDKDFGQHYTIRPTNTSVLYCIKYTNPLIPQIKY